ncbi:MAG: hypothetical protein HQL22_05355 [Candidatus Omnitrophica bacterium]|nr:hypothetical protein [Candidatus Omnitrophota bacterium]
MRLITFFILILVMVLCSGNAVAQEAFIDMKSTHFMVRYTLPEESAAALEVLSKAEQILDRISRDIGFVKYTDFWTWDKRVKIILFPDQISYTRFTGQAQWSRGYASRNSKLFRDRVVVTYNGQAEMNSAILPHEIAHLVFWDLLGQNYAAAPEWFEEGIAQLEEQDKRDIVREAMRPVVISGKHIPFHVFMNLKPSEMQDETQVSLFYAQSLSVVLFLIEKYGQDSFYRLSKELRNGCKFEIALTRVYGGIFTSMSEFESRWLKYAAGDGG